MRRAASGWSRAATSSSPASIAGDHAYILQQPDGRIVFAIPYQRDFTEIGTTDVPVERPEDARIAPDEIDYLCDAINGHFTAQITPGRRHFELVGRPPALRRRRQRGEGGDPRLCARTRCVDGAAPLLSVFGGKITTARYLAEEALGRIGDGARHDRSAR